MMTDKVVISVDGACSGSRCACAARVTRNGRVIAAGSRSLPEIEGYVLAAEIAAVALAVGLAADEDAAAKFVVETDNPDVPRVIEQGYRPKQAERIPAGLLASVVEFTRTRAVAFERLPRNSTPGLRRAHRLASRQLWQGRRIAAVADRLPRATPAAERNRRADLSQINGARDRLSDLEGPLDIDF
jgi:hypothetical protein